MDDGSTAGSPQQRCESACWCQPRCQASICYNVLTVLRPQVQGCLHWEMLDQGLLQLSPAEQAGDPAATHHHQGRTIMVFLERQRHRTTHTMVDNRPFLPSGSPATMVDNRPFLPSGSPATMVDNRPFLPSFLPGPLPQQRLNSWPACISKQLPANCKASHE
jgi:hypothetical protein